MTEERKKAELKISGMTCTMCATTIEKSLLDQEGVAGAEVNLGNETAVVEYDSTLLKLADLEKAVTDAGYDVINDKLVLKIGGMACAMCVKTIEDAIKRLDGISSVIVNLSAEKAYVTYNPKMTSVADMKRAIEDAGYQYLGVAGEETEDLEEVAREIDLREKRNRFIVGFAVGIPLMILMRVTIDFPFSMAYFMLVVSTPAFIYVSHPIFSAAYRALKNRNLNMDVMYSMGIGVAFVSSLLATSGILTQEFLFYDTALILASFLTIGRYMETRAKGRTSEAIKKQKEVMNMAIDPVCKMEVDEKTAKINYAFSSI